DLDLPYHGFEVIPQESTFQPLPDGRYLFRRGNEADAFQAIAKFSRRDAEAYPRFGRLMARLAKFIAPTLTMTPPDVGSLNPAELRKLLALNKQVKTLTEDELYTFARLMTMSAADYLDEWFETDVLKAGLCSSGIIGTLLGRSGLPADFGRGIETFKIEGSSGKANFALSETPSFSALPGNGPHLQGAISIGPSVDYIEKAYDDAKYGDFSHRPFIDMCIPSTLDPTLAPPGKHIMSCFIQYAPYTLRNGRWPDRREAFAETVIDTIEEYVPNLRDIILHQQ